MGENKAPLPWKGKERRISPLFLLANGGLDGPGGSLTRGESFYKRNNS